VETTEERRASLFSRFTTVQDEPEVEEIVEEDEATETDEPEADAEVNADLYALLDEDPDNETDKLNNE
jgi:hypothetical protein